MVIISAGVSERREAGACQSAAVPQCEGQMHSKLCHLFGRVLLSIPGTFGQRGGRVTGKWTLAPHYIKGGNGGRKSGESRPDIMDTRQEKTVNRDSMQAEKASFSDVSSTRSMSSPGRARRVSMKIKKGLKGVKEMLSPHHHHHPDGGDGEPGEERQERQRRRKSGPNESRRGPLAPVLDHLEKSNSVPIHLHISHTGSFSISRKGSSSSYSCSDFAQDESKTSADIHQHTQAQQSQQEQQSSESDPEPQPAMDVPEAFVVPPSPRRSDDGEETPNPFLVDDPEDPLSDPGSPPPAPVLPLDTGSLLPETSPSESVTLSPAPSSEPPLPAEPAPQAPAVDKPVPALPVVSDTESEQEAPAVHLPQLVMPTMFLPIPNVRINSYLTWWLTRRAPIYY